MLFLVSSASISRITKFNSLLLRKRNSLVVILATDKSTEANEMCATYRACGRNENYVQTLEINLEGTKIFELFGITNSWIKKQYGSKNLRT